ncbi:MAG TPA: hypothetical protein VMG33_00510 [Steroidobacteraceae bacterium]|nr:hypothetical protein [Steroidobacteraceae bacterium]
MRPLAALLAILTGSAVALTVGLLLTWVTILFLPAQEARFAPEHAALLKAIAVFGIFATIAGASLYGELRERSWRLGAHAATLGMFAVAVWAYWPR